MPLKIKRKRRDAEEIPLASTSDIAFLLIVFFLTASALLEFRGVQIPLPKSDAPPMQILRENLFKIHISDAGEYTYEGKVIPLYDLQKMVRKAADANPELVVVLRVSPNAPSSSVPVIIKRLQDERIVRFSMGMEE